MKKQEIKKLGKEEGFFSAFVLVFLVTLGLMGVGASILVQSESKNISHHINSVKSDYLMEGAAFYATAALSTGTLTSDTSFTVENVDVVVDTLYDGDKLIMEVTATLGDYERTNRFELKQHSLWEKAIYVHENVSNTHAKDSTGSVDDNLIVSSQSPMPSVDNAALYLLSTTQGNNRGGPFTPTTNFPSANFYQPDGHTPNVSHIFGDMTVTDYVIINGIFVVDGNVFLTRRADVRGIIYLVNSGTQVQGNNSGGARTDIQGGIFGFGSVTAINRALYVSHNPEWMRVFDRYVGPIPGGTEIAHWSY